MRVRRPSAATLVVTLGILGAALGPTEAHAGAWTKAFGDYYVKAGADFYKATSYVDPTTGEVVEGLEFFGQQYSIYGEVGVLPWWPLQVAVMLPVSVGTTTFEEPTVFPEGESARATSARLGDLRVMLQTSILKKDFQLSPAFELKVPMYSNDSVGSDFGTWSEAFPLPGDGQLDVTGWLMMGGAIPKAPVFIQGGLGYRHRTEVFVDWTTDLVFVDGIPFTTTIGVTAGPFLGMLQLDGIKNIKEDDVTRENISLGFGAFVTVWKGLAIEARVAGDVWANNAARGVSFGAGLSWRSL